MKLFNVLAALLVCMAAANVDVDDNPHHRHGGHHKVAHHHKPIDADLSADPAVKYMRGTASQQEGRSSHEIVPPADQTSLHDLREKVEELVNKAANLDSADVISVFERELLEVQNTLAKHGGEDDLLDEVKSVRAGLCSDGRFKRHGCQKFMSGVCGKTSPVPKDYCESFFYSSGRRSSTETETQAEDQNVLKQAVAAEERAEKVTEEATNEVDAETEAESDKAEQEADADAEVEVMGPAPGPAPGPEARFHMNSLTPVAEQGFQGEAVHHTDKETMIGDWNNEFGPKSGHRSPRTICKDHPNNKWCKYHGLYPKKHKKVERKKSDAGRARVAAAVVAAVALIGMRGM